MLSFVKLLNLMVCFLLAITALQSGGDGQTTRSVNGTATTTRNNRPTTTRRNNDRNTTARSSNVSSTTTRRNGPSTTQRRNGPSTTQRANGTATTRRANGTATTRPARYPTAKVTADPTGICTTGYAAKIEVITFLITFNYTNIHSLANVRRSRFKFYSYNDSTDEGLMLTTENAIGRCLKPSCNIVNKVAYYKLRWEIGDINVADQTYISVLWEIPLTGTFIRRFVQSNILELGPISNYNRHTLNVAFNTTNESRTYKLQQEKYRVVLGSNTAQSMLLTFCALDGQRITEQLTFKTCDGEQHFIEPQGEPPYCYNFNDTWNGTDCAFEAKYETPASSCRKESSLKALIRNETSFWETLEEIYLEELSEYF